MEIKLQGDDRPKLKLSRRIENVGNSPTPNDAVCSDYPTALKCSVATQPGTIVLE